ncbi:MAG TPA: GAF domain-containing sensor histidine kinase [Solirubrobacteraceae bacterium]|nr:GAF domain-containing sensor histidine kinase [Solirubrobacteraceae bacterium]
MHRVTDGILGVARSVLAELDLDVVLDRVLEAGQELTEARYAAVGVLNESKSELIRFLTRGIDEDAHAAIGQLPRGRGVLGVLIEDPEPLRVVDIGRHPRSYGFPYGHPPMHTFLGVPILVEGSPFGNLYLTEKAGGAEFSEADEQAAVVLAEFAGVAINHARRYTGTREHRDELKRAVAALDATTQVARAIGGETDLETILELIAKRGRALVSARALLIGLGQGEEILIAAGAGELPAGVIGRRVDVNGTVAGQVMRTGRAHRLEDELTRARFHERGLGRLGVNPDAGLAVPLVFAGQAHGVLLVLDRIGDDPAFTAEDERLLEAFATSAATAVANAESIAYERRRQRMAAAESERRRWARELHDETLQSLGALRTGLSTARRSEQPDALAQVVGEAIDHLEEAIANLRALITDLRPATLDELGVHAALEGLADRARRQGIAVDLDVDLDHEQGREPTRYIIDLETALYRIVQEALTNACKHGEAKRAVVEVRDDSTTVHLTVRDDGKGFDPNAETDGFGLLGMRERVELLGGRVEIDSAPGRGAVVKAGFPVQRRHDGARAGDDAIHRALGGADVRAV